MICRKMEVSVKSHLRRRRFRGQFEVNCNFAQLPLTSPVVTRGRCSGERWYRVVPTRDDGSSHRRFRSFTRKYFDEEEKQHMYARVTDVFKAWDLSNYEGDLFGPSKAQFAGMGSIGNGGGMRIAPVPLYFANDITSIIEVTVIDRPC